VNRLVLYTRDAEAPVAEMEELRAALAQSGFIGREIVVSGARRFQPGRRFAELLAMAGARAAHRSIELTETRGEIDFLGGENVRSPECNCGFVVSDWPGVLESWAADRPGYRFSCPSCGVARKPWELDWKRSAAFGRCSVDVLDIDLGEATPGPELLAVLASLNQTVWDYFYRTDSAAFLA